MNLYLQFQHIKLCKNYYIVYYQNTSHFIMLSKAKHDQMKQLEEINEAELLISVKESDLKTPDKQHFNSVYSQGISSRTISPDFNRIQSLQNLSEEDIVILNSVIRKLRQKDKIEISSNQNNSIREIHENQNNIVLNFLGRVRSKQSEPSQSVDQDPVESSNEFKIDMFRNLLRKSAEQNKEKDSQIRELLLKVEQLKIYQSQNKHKQNLIQQLKHTNQNLQHELSIKTLQLQKNSNVTNELQLQMASLQRKLQHLESQATQNQVNSQRQLNQTKMKQAEKILFYTEKLESYQTKLAQQMERRVKDAQRIRQLQEIVKKFQEQSLKVKLELERKKNDILPGLQEKITQCMNEFNKLQQQKQSIHTKNQLLQREIETYQATVQQLKQQREKLQIQVKRLGEENIQSHQNAQTLQKQILKLQKTNTQLQSSNQKNVKQVLKHQNTIKLKDSELKTLRQKCEKLQNQLSKKQTEISVLRKQAQKGAQTAEKIRKSQIINNQRESRINALEKEKANISTNLQKELKETIQKYELELKRVKNEKDEWRSRFLQQSKKNPVAIEQYNKNKTLIEQQKKSKQGRSTQNSEIFELKNLIKQYEKQLQSNSYQSIIQRRQFQEKLQLRQRQLVEKDEKIQQIIQKNLQSQAISKAASQKETNQSKLSMFFELLSGFKRKMSPSQFSSLRLKIGLIMT